jgi:hypothetical protein
VLGERLAVGHLGLADGGVDVELAQHAVDQHLEVQLAHARDEGLARLLVGLHDEGGVLLGEGVEGLAHLVLVGLGLGLDRNLDDRLGELRFSKMIGSFSSEIVSPVRVFLRPMPTAMSPADTKSRSSRLLACMRRMRPTRSFWPVRLLSTLSPLFRCPSRPGSR